jgi:hypothetical protein
MRILGSFLLLLVGSVILASGCTGIDYSKPLDSPILQSQVGSVSIEVRGAAVGIPDAILDKMVQAGVRQGCPRQMNGRIIAAAAPALSMVWSIQRSGPGPLVIVTAALFSGSRDVSFTFDQILSPNAEPTDAFVYAIATITCSLYRKAGYLTMPKPMALQPISKESELLAKLYLE